MPTYLENLKTRRDNISAELAAVVNANASGTPNAGGLPNTSGDGINNDNQGYVRQLEDSLDKVVGMIVDAENKSSGDMFESLEY